MGKWVHPYAVLHVQGGVSFRGKGVWPSLHDVVVSWLRLQTPIDCIPHPYCMYVGTQMRKLPIPVRGSTIPVLVPILELTSVLFLIAIFPKYNRIH